MGVEIRDYRVYLLLIKARNHGSTSQLHQAYRNTRIVHRYDIAWYLRPDVNILSGINGVGKTTILNRSVNYLEQTSGEVKSDEKNGVHVYFDNSGSHLYPL